jgi:DNA-binding XRE family transcriptional regulator
VAVRDNRIRTLRLERGLVMARLAALADIGMSTLVAIEVHEYFPTEKVRMKIAHALGVPVGEVWPAEEPRAS